MIGSAGVGILFIQVATVFHASAPALRLVSRTLTVRSPRQEEGPTVTVRSVVKDGPAANSARTPMPGDMLVKVDGYDVRGLSLAELRPWITGDEGSVVTLSFDGANMRYDTSVVRRAGPGPGVGTGDMHGRIPSYGAAEPRERPDDVHDFDRWRQDPLYNPASDDWRLPPAYDADQGYITAHGYDDEPCDSPHRAPAPHTHYPGGSAREASRLGVSRRATSTSWAVEADKILAQAQAKIEDALQRERLLQETLDMLREKNASKMRNQKDTRMRLETQRDRLKADLEEERERLRMETRSRDAIEAELRKSEERLFMLTAHADRDQGDGTLF